MRKRPIKLSLRLTPEEHAHLKNQAVLSGCSQEQYLRKLLAGERIRPRPPNELPALLTQLSRIGNNINQIARTANSRSYVTRDEVQRIETLLGEIWEKVKGL